MTDDIMEFKYFQQIGYSAVARIHSIKTDIITKFLFTIYVCDRKQCDSRQTHNRSSNEFILSYAKQR